MKQIMDTVQALGLQPPEESFTVPSPELTGQVAAVFRQVQAQDQKQQALIRALLPYLRPGKQRRLERAMQVAKLSHLAGFALQSSEQEDNHV